jgi:hypothetical protein
MTAPPPIGAEPDDIRPPDYWGRHPLTKVVGFAAIGAAAVGRDLIDGDSGTLVTAGGGIVFMSMCIVAAVDHMRGLVAPLPGRDWKLMSPIAGIAWAAALLLGSVLIALDVIVGSDDPSPWIRGGAIGAAALFVVGVFIQIASLSDQWPDKWRPPYARQQAADAPAAADPGDGPADRTPDQA